MRNIVLILLCLMLATPSNAWAGRSCMQREITAVELQRASDVAVNVYNYLEKTDASIALVGRMGSDLSQYGLKYSHMGIAVRDHPKGRWYFVHELNKCGTTKSDIFNEGLVNFYLDDSYDYDSLVLIPSAQIQQNIVEFLNSGGAKRVHNANYSMVSNPFSAKYQNSNEFVLAVLVSAQHQEMLQGKGVVKIAEFLKFIHYQPTTIRVGFLKRLGASIFRANASFDDHRGSKVSFVSVKSIVDYLHRTEESLWVKEIEG